MLAAACDPVALPTSRSTPSTSADAAGYTTSSCPDAVVQTSSSMIEITGLTLLDVGSCTITYGDQSGGGPGATAPTNGGYTPSTFETEEMSSALGTLTELASGSPEMTVTAADGSGTMQVTPQSVITSSSGNYLTFVFLAPAGGIDDGDFGSGGEIDAGANDGVNAAGNGRADFGDLFLPVFELGD